LFAPLEKCVGHGLKLLDIVQKIWAPLRRLFAPPGVPSWLRSCYSCYFPSYCKYFGNLSLPGLEFMVGKAFHTFQAMHVCFLPLLGSVAFISQAHA